MSTAVAPPSRQKLAAQGRTAPGKVTGKLKTAIHAMVWLGMKRAEAAQAAGLKDQSLYVAFTRSHVRRYYLEQCEVLRLSGHARRLHRLEQIAESDRNMAASVAAIRASEDLGEDERAPGRGAFGPTAPGFTILIRREHVSEMPESPIVDVTPSPAAEPLEREPVPPAIARAAPRRR